MEKVFSSPGGNGILKTIKDYYPHITEAMHFVESQKRIIPWPAFSEMKDVISHMYDILKSPDNEENVFKNLVEIKEHFRRGVIETYQELYDFEMSFLFQSYGKYRNQLQHFEKILFIYKKNSPHHIKISSVIKSSQELWIEARNLKVNELNDDFKKSIQHFKDAYLMVISVEDNINELWNNFYQRSSILAIILIVIFVSTLAII